MESLHLEGDDQKENVHELDSTTLKKREVRIFLISLIFSSILETKFGKYLHYLVFISKMIFALLMK